MTAKGIKTGVLFYALFFGFCTYVFVDEGVEVRWTPWEPQDVLIFCGIEVVMVFVSYMRVRVGQVERSPAAASFLSLTVVWVLFFSFLQWPK